MHNLIFHEVCVVQIMMQQFLYLAQNSNWRPKCNERILATVKFDQTVNWIGSGTGNLAVEPVNGTVT